MRARLAIVGAGLIGKRHADAIDHCSDAMLAGIVDPEADAGLFAASRNVECFDSLADLFAAQQIDGAIIATPNQLHLPNAIECIEQGCPILVEKPVATNVAEAEKLVAAGAKANVAVLAGHHRRYNDLIRKAKAIIDAGTLGTIGSVQATCWLYKPDDYFKAEWRTQVGAGPVFINLIHDIDLLRHLCGDVEIVQAMESNAIRGHQVEDSAVIMLRFKSGALATINVSDTAVAPWSWELTARENPAYPATSQSCYLIGGTKASLSLPDLGIWQYEGEPSWWNPISTTRPIFNFDDPLNNQIDHFVDVIKHGAKPVVSAKDGLETLRIIEAVKRSASGGQAVVLS